MELSSTTPVTVFAPPPIPSVATLSTPTSMPSIVEVRSSNSGVMKQIMIEIPAEGSLLKKSGQADVWLKPLIVPVEN